MKQIVLLLIVAAMGYHPNAEANIIQLCVDERNWYPFVFVPERGRVDGIHVEIVKKSLDSLGYAADIIAYPRKQCINRVKNNEVDGMISIAYHPGLADFFEFPPGSATAKRSDWRIMQVDYMVVSHRSGSFKFLGNPRTLPNPIRIPYGETIVSDLRQDGFSVDDGARDDRRNFLKLLRDEDGVVITTSVMAERYIKELDIPDKITIHSIPLKSQSYYLAFSNQGSITAREKEKIWQEIIKWRKDYVFMLQLFAKY